MNKLTRTALVATTTLTMIAGIAAPAAQANVASWTGMGPQLPPSDSYLSGGRVAAENPLASPEGANEDCVSDENPVVLLHGMTSNAYGTFSTIAPALKSQGRCVFAFDYGDWEGPSLAAKIPGVKGLASVPEMIDEVDDYVARIKEHTGAAKVDFVGWSLGATLATEYARRHGAQGVGTVFSIGGVLRGTDFFGQMDKLYKLQAMGLPIEQSARLTFGPVANDLPVGSPFMNDFTARPLEVPGVRYISVSSRFDQVAHPIANTSFECPDAENYVIQDACKQDQSGHLDMGFSPYVIGLMQQSFGADIEVPCTYIAAPGEEIRSLLPFR